jgi:ABC-type branched-subunit amino acid transport system permease subunit
MFGSFLKFIRGLVSPAERALRKVRELEARAAALGITPEKLRDAEKRAEDLIKRAKKL